MQNEQTLLDLGFRKLERTGEYFFRGRHQKFTARICEPGKRAYVALYVVSPRIDQRLLSHHRGYQYRIPLKDCCSAGSVERALQHFDTPTLTRSSLLCTTTNQ